MGFPIIPIIHLTTTLITKIGINVGTSYIGDKVYTYLKNRQNKFTDKIEHSNDKNERIIILQKEIIDFKTFQIEILKKLFNNNNDKKIDIKKELIEFDKFDTFIEEYEINLEKLIK